MNSFKNISYIPDLSEGDMAYCEQTGTIWIGCDGQNVKMDNGYLISVSYEEFLKMKKPTVNNISYLLCDKGDDIRNYARKWYKENMVKNDNRTKM